MRKIPPKKKILFIITAFLLILILPCLAAEGFYRLRYPNLDLWQLTGRKATAPGKDLYLNEAFSAYRPRPEYLYEKKGINKTVNEHGFMSTPLLPVRKPEGTLRIVFLGGSSTAGMGKVLSDEDTWPWLVTEQLRQKFPDIEIDFINGSAAGYTSFESYGRLWSRLRFFEPDIIVLYHGWNEMYYFDDADKAVRWRTNRNNGWRFHRTRRLRLVRPHWSDHLLRHSQVMTKVRLLFSKQARAGEISENGEDAALKDHYDVRSLEIWRENLRLFKQTAELMEARLFVGKQATLMTPELDPEHRKRCRAYVHQFDYEAHVDAFERIYEVIDDEFDPESIIDMTPLSGKPEYFHDHIHPTVLGSQKIAETVSTHIADYLSSR